MIRLMIVHLTPMKSVLSAEVEFEFYFCVLEKGYIIDLAHTQLGTKTSKRKGNSYVQTREWEDKNNRGYDEETPKKDVDWTDHARADHITPHEHPYNKETGKRE